MAHIRQSGGRHYLAEKVKNADGRRCVRYIASLGPYPTVAAALAGLAGDLNAARASLAATGTAAVDLPTRRERIRLRAEADKLAHDLAALQAWHAAQATSDSAAPA